MMRNTPRVRRILVAIGDLRNTPRSHLRKAATLARSLQARVELFHAITEPVVPNLAHRSGNCTSLFSHARAVIEQRLQGRLDRDHLVLRLIGGERDYVWLREGKG